MGNLKNPILFPDHFHLPPRDQDGPDGLGRQPPADLYDAWLASRRLPAHPDLLLVPGAQRPLTLDNARLAWFVARNCTLDLFKALFDLNPFQTTLMMALHIVRSLFPAFRGYSQALIVDELQSLIASRNFTWSRLFYLISTEVLRRALESMLDSWADANESTVMGSARFFIEYKQMEQRVRLDVPTLADPTVRSLLQESECFSRSFSSRGLGVLSPLEFIQVFSLLTEICSHVFLLVSLTRGASNFGLLLLSIASILIPGLLSWITCPSDQPDLRTTAKEERAAYKQERLRNLAYSDVHRPEIALFGLADWILKSWATARRVSLAAEQPHYRTPPFLEQFKLTDLILAVQNIPLLLLYDRSSATLGSLTVYRTSLQALVYSFRHLVMTINMVFQGLFLMSAFMATLHLKPKLNPKHEDTVQYISTQDGVSIEAKGLSYTYPNSTEPALRNVTFSLKAGESLAIVGFNGSGKSTLARILLRIVDYDKGTLLVNGHDIRRYKPSDYHSHVSAVFQGFSKFNSTVKENIGLGNVDKISYSSAIDNAVRLAEANTLVESLPYGLKTMLSTNGNGGGFDGGFSGSSGSPFSFPTRGGVGMPTSRSQNHDLSGGEWQRIALARAFMRANEPEVDLLLFDEPTSALDAHAQNQIFDTLEKITRSSAHSGRKKTVIFITHRLSTARRADKVAMMENGTITEFGTHEELLAKNKAYASLYRASL